MKLLLHNRVFVPLQSFVYARHGCELMGLKSPVNVPVLSIELNTNY